MSWAFSSMVRVTRHISSFKEIRDSRFYLDLKKYVNQWLFGAVVLKQMALMLGNVECSKPFSSTMLESAQLMFCHCWARGKQSKNKLYSRGMEVQKASKSWLDDGNMKECSSCLEILSKNCQRSKMQKWESELFFWSWLQSAGSFFSARLGLLCFWQKKWDADSRVR